MGNSCICYFGVCYLHQCFISINASFHSNPKECSNYLTIALISHASKVMLKILQARLQQYVNCKLSDVQALEKAEEPKIKLPTSTGSWKKQESSRKHLFLLYWLYQSLCVDHNQLWKILRWEYQTNWPASWEICKQDRKQQLELDMEQVTGSK